VQGVTAGRHPLRGESAGVLLALTWNSALSVAAIVLAGFSTWYAHQANERAGRAEQRDVERIGRERQQAEAENRASLMLWATGSYTNPNEARVAYRIQNSGKVIAHNVRVWLRDADGNNVTLTPQPSFDLAPDQADSSRGVPVPLNLELDKLRFTVAWDDAEGPHEWETETSAVPSRRVPYPS